MLLIVYFLTPSVVDFLILNPEFTTWLPRVGKVLHVVQCLLSHNMMHTVFKMYKSLLQFLKDNFNQLRRNIIENARNGIENFGIFSLKDEIWYLNVVFKHISPGCLEGQITSNWLTQNDWPTRRSEDNKQIATKQTWKKLQAVQAALADILSEITLFWGHFESDVLYFWMRMEEEELTMENWGLMKEDREWRI